MPCGYLLPPHHIPQIRLPKKPVTAPMTTNKIYSRRDSLLYPSRWAHLQPLDWMQVRHSLMRRMASKSIQSRSTGVFALKSRPETFMVIPGWSFIDQFHRPRIMPLHMATPMLMATILYSSLIVIYLHPSPMISRISASVRVSRQIVGTEFSPRSFAASTRP